MRADAHKSARPAEHGGGGGLGPRSSRHDCARIGALNTETLEQTLCFGEREGSLGSNPPSSGC